MAISREQIEKLRIVLREAPDPPASSVNTTKQEAVRLLVGEIQAIQRRGYSLEQVADMLRDGDLVLTTPTLKNYLARAKAPRKGRPGKRAQAEARVKAPAPSAGTPGVSAPEANCVFRSIWAAVPA